MLNILVLIPFFLIQHNYKKKALVGELFSSSSTAAVIYDFSKSKQDLQALKLDLRSVQNAGSLP